METVISELYERLSRAASGKSVADSEILSQTIRRRSTSGDSGLSTT